MHLTALHVERIARKLPMPDGNKRLAWQALTIFLALNGHQLEVSNDDAVQLMAGAAARDHDEEAACHLASCSCRPARLR